MNLFKRGAFLLHSGEVSSFKIDCDALTDEDIDTCAMLIASKVKKYSFVHGIPEGGKRIANALKKYCSPGCNTVLIVDDILTTGESMRAARKEWPSAIGAVIFCRRAHCLSWVTPLFQM